MEENNKTSWMDDVKIEIPLRKFVKMKKKIIEFEQEVKEQRHRYYQLRDSYDRLQQDYKDILGVKDAEGDDGK